MTRRAAAATSEPVDGSGDVAQAVDGSAIAPPVDAGDLVKPVDGRRRRKPVDGMQEKGASYDHALRFAQGKGQHSRRPGTLELPQSTWSWSDGWTGTKCQGQLRSTYARLTIPSERYGVAGRTKWTPVAVWCDGCGATWVKPLDPAEATRKRPGRW